MRLTKHQIGVINTIVKRMLGEGVAVSLFGSRLDDSRKGGDVDLLIEADKEPGLLQRASIKNQLEEGLQLPVDIVTSSFDKPNAFARIARAQAVPLKGMNS